MNLCLQYIWFLVSFLNIASGQEIPLPEKMPQTHPRVLTTPAGKQETWKLIKKEEWAKDVFNKLKERTEVYTNLTDAQPAWLLSRLAMYWKSHATEVYVKGETFDHAGGERAPYPTVRYTGTRGTAATHGRPKLADVVPYDDEDGNVSVEIVVGNLKTAILRFADLMEIMVGILCFLEKEKELMVQ